MKNVNKKYINQFIIKLNFVLCFSLVFHVMYGQTLVSDINSGSSSSDPEELIVFGDKLFFVADNGGGRALWYTDGTVTSIVNGSVAGSDPRELTIIGNTLVYSTNNSVSYINMGGTNQEALVTEAGASFLVVQNKLLMISNLDNTFITIWSTDLPLSNATTFDKAIGPSLSGIYDPWFLSHSRIQVPDKSLVANFNKTKVVFAESGNNDDIFIYDIATNNYDAYPLPETIGFGGSGNMFFTRVGDYIIYTARPSAFEYGLGYISTVTPDTDSGFIDGIGIPAHYTEFGSSVFYSALDPSSNYMTWYIDLQPGDVLVESDFKLLENNNIGGTPNTSYSFNPYNYFDGNLYYGQNRIFGVPGNYSMEVDPSCLGVTLSNGEIYFADCCSQLYSCSNPLVPQTCLIEFDNEIIEATLFNDRIYFATFQPDIGVELYKFPEDSGNGLCQGECNNDIVPPVCTVQDITLSDDTGLSSLEITFTDYVIDDCGLVSFSNGSDLTNGVSVLNNESYPCNSITDFEVVFLDEAGNPVVCNYTVTIDCEDDLDNCLPFIQCENNDTLLNSCEFIVPEYSTEIEIIMSNNSAPWSMAPRSGANGHVIAIKENGTMWGWGWNGEGQLGLSGNSSISTPTLIDCNFWIDVAIGNSHSLALRDDGTIWTTGSNTFGQLGFIGVNNLNTFQQVGSNSDWEKVFCGEFQSYAIKEDGTLWAWGHNFMGNLGIGDDVNRFTPTQVGIDNDWNFIVKGGGRAFGALALKNDGSVWGWGENEPQANILFPL